MTGEPLYGYIALYRGKRHEVYANTSLEAQELAAKHFKARKRWEVTVHLAEVDGQPITHTPVD